MSYTMLNSMLSEVPHRHGVSGWNVVYWNQELGRHVSDFDVWEKTTLWTVHDRRSFHGTASVWSICCSRVKSVMDGSFCSLWRKPVPFIFHSTRKKSLKLLT